jgi:integrase
LARKRLSAKLHLLTVREVQTAGEGDHADGGGLLLRVRGALSSWVYRYTAASGRRREMGLGAAHRSNAALTGESLTVARAIAAEKRAMLAREIDPIDERDRAKDTARAVQAAAKAEKARERVTLCRWARDYHERVIEPSRTSKHSAQWIASLENHVPAAVWSAPIASIEAPALLKALSGITAHERARNLTGGQRVPETVQRIRQRLDAVFEDAIFHKHCTSNPAAAIRRKMREAAPRRERGEFLALPYAEAPAFLQQLRAAQGIAARCLEFALLTAARTNEAIGAEWSEFDLEAGTWILPPARMKGGELHTVWLTERAVQLVRGQLGLDQRFVFPSPTGSGKPLSNMAMLTVLDRMQMRERTTVHGVCRATFSTWANETAAARPDVIEACLAHREGDKVRASYNRAKFGEERRTLLAAWSEYLHTPRAQIMPLRAA